VSVAGKPVRNVPDLTGVLSGLEPGKTVEVVVLRGEAEVRLDVTLGERPGRGRRP
jgi:S1-C subfamily serine protease